MKPLQRSSGDLTADRRADFAEMLFAAGEHAAAAETMLGALEIAPAWALGWYRLGELHEAAGQPEAAAEAWRMSLKLEPDDRPGAALKLEIAGAGPRSAAPPSAFVEALFDHYAATFDQSLLGKLGYRVPGLLGQAIEALGDRRFARAIDLGCGTGLMGERLRPLVDRLEGYDISAAMVRKSAARGIYDRVGKAAIQTLEFPDGGLDLVAAADVVMYLGALEDTVRQVARWLGADGLFAFSTERHPGPEDYVLRPTRRYAHSAPYVVRLLQAAGFAVACLDAAAIRLDRGEPVEGLIVVAVRS